MLTCDAVMLVYSSASLIEGTTLCRGDVKLRNSKNWTLPSNITPQASSAHFHLGRTPMQARLHPVFSTALHGQLPFPA